MSEEYQHQILGYECPIKNVTGNANIKIQNSFIDWAKFSNLSNWENAASSGYKAFKITGLKPRTTYTFCRTDNEGYGHSIYAGFNNASNNTNRFINAVDSSQCLKSVSATSTSNGELYVTMTPATEQYFQSFLSYVKNAWVVEGTDYKAKVEQNYPFTFAEGQRGMQGTTLQDDGIHNKKKHKVFNGTESWSLWSVTNTDVIAFYKTNAITDAKANELICNYFQNTYYGAQTQGVESIALNINNGTLGIGIRKSELTSLDVAGFKEWLSTHNLDIEYPLKDSELENNIIPYNATQQEQYNAKKQARSYDDMTIISSESDELGFNMDVESLGNINKVINNLLNN